MVEGFAQPRHIVIQAGWNRNVEIALLHRHYRIVVFEDSLIYHIHLRAIFKRSLTSSIS